MEAKRCCWCIRNSLLTVALRQNSTLLSREQNFAISTLFVQLEKESSDLDNLGSVGNPWHSLQGQQQLTTISNNPSKGYLCCAPLAPSA